jgi:hypothetical protein
MFDIAVAAPLKNVFKLELDRRISCFTGDNPGERDKAQILRRTLMESFINASHHGATPANIISHFRPQISCHSTLKYHWSHNSQSILSIRYCLRFIALELRSMRSFSPFHMRLTFCVAVNGGGQWKTPITILTIDRSGKILTGIRWQRRGHSQIHLQCSFV